MIRIIIMLIVALIIIFGFIFMGQFIKFVEDYDEIEKELKEDRQDE